MNPTARRQKVMVVVIGAVVGGLLILAFERYRIPLRDWLTEPGVSPGRIRATFLILTALLLAPLLGLTIYLGRLGRKARREAAAAHGLRLQLLALGLGVATLVLALLLWRLARLFGGLHT